MLGRHYFTSWASCLQYPLKMSATLKMEEYFVPLPQFVPNFSCLKTRVTSLASLLTLILIRSFIPLFLLVVIR